MSQENTLIKIMNIAERESLKGTHPELEPILSTVDNTIATLVKQLNGVVSGQDLVLKDYKERLEIALKDKNEAKVFADISEKIVMLAD